MRTEGVTTLDIPFGEAHDEKGARSVDELLVSTSSASRRPSG
jgi:hypothetical protein